MPTRNRSIHSAGLRKLLRAHEGVAPASARAAGTARAFPVRDGEAVDPEYQRFLPGSGLTKNILPHYDDQMDETLDGPRFMADIVLPDSVGRTFYALQDGSCLYTDAEHGEIRGEAYEIKEGRTGKSSSSGDAVLLQQL